VPAVVLDLLYNSFQVVGPLIALYTVAARSDRRVSVRAAVATIPVLAVTLVDETGRTLGPSLAVFPLFAAGWLLGENVRTRRAYLQGLERRPIAWSASVTRTPAGRSRRSRRASLASCMTSWPTTSA
jgi:hypothetical protein